MSDESYVDFIMPVMDSMVGGGEITQVLLRDCLELEKALRAPVTAFIYITMRPLHDRAYELDPLVQRLQNELSTIPGCHGSSWGPSLADNNITIGVIGWRSVTVRVVPPSRSLKLLLSHPAGPEQCCEGKTTASRYTRPRAQ